MDVGGAYGAGKAGAPFDPLLFVKRPQVVAKGVCLLFGIIVFWCVSGAWYVDQQLQREVCLYNKKSSACHLGEALGLIALFAALGFLGGEYMFGQMSSVKSRKHYVLIDLGFSGFWAFLYFIGFCYLANQWSNTNIEESILDREGTSGVQSAIFFSFLSVFTWAGSAWLAYQRYQQGNQALFPSGIDGGESQMTGATAYSYSQDDQAYQDPPFSNQHEGGGEYPAPTY